ncbi:unnamed protein product [Eruca vesicaria subsp. sativa]|uniref:Anaphase-promoting complex subunit 4-like WD40 domain-containing protein n=1 Tax=Eruca vesicaria subsp. sativa TaxID=29727 RepID=A0ABC8M395_ERUVS|nr:unnamed protein product [Eruca vesicaria subsp. sativa]
MESKEGESSIPFQLQFDKPIPFQRLWTTSPGRSVTSLCWRPDGKAIAVGLEDGTIALHNVKNGKLLRSLKPYAVAVVCPNWEGDGQSNIVWFRL